MKKITLFISAFALILSSGFSQTQINTITNTASISRVKKTLQRCSTDEVMKALRDQDPVAFDMRKAQREQQYQNWIANNYNPLTQKAVITIPVVVQIWENTSTVPDSRVTQQLNRLNLDFRGTNPDRANTPSAFPTADCEIEFCLASQDPNGNPTTGIVRRTVNGSPPSSGGTDMWDPTKYLNIYVYDIGGGTLGFTYLSSQSPNQAVHIGTNYFGNTGGIYGMGRTASHEIGHWFNLEHIWGDNNCGNDFVNDTPTQQTANSGCPSHPHITCSNSGDMFMNYMDYVNDACMVAFTPGQKARMIAAINNDRPGILTSNGCASTGLTADFTASVTTINEGQTVTFTDASSGPNTIISWDWDFDVTNNGGVTPGTASSQGAHVVTYNNAGTYTVSLEVGDGSNTDLTTKNSYITVLAAGTQTCDSTAANWDINNATHTGATAAYTWAADCNGPTAISGYILGHNCYDDNGWADKITYGGSGTYLTDVIYYFGTATGSGNVNLKVWGDNAGIPNNGNVMAQQSVAISALSTGGTGTLWSPASPPVLNGDFYVGFDHSSAPAAGDTAALMSAPTAGINTVFANETGGWLDLSTYIDHGAAVIPVICNSISTGEKELVGNVIKNVTIFPNPTNGTINVALPSKVVSSIEVYNVVGKLVYSTKPLSTQLITVNVGDQPAGIYFINVKTGNTVVTKKVMLSK